MHARKASHGLGGQRQDIAWAPAGVDKEGALPPLPLCKCCKVFLCISSYSKTLSRQVIYALFSHSGGFAPDPHRDPSLDPAEGLSSQAPNLLTPGKNPAGDNDTWTGLLVRDLARVIQERETWRKYVHGEAKPSDRGRKKRTAF